MPKNAVRSKLTITAAGLIAALAIGASFLISSGQRITLVANGRIDVLERAAIAPAENSIIGTIQKGEEAAVIGCVDLKHYIVPKVAMNNGQTGYVVAGDFQLVRANAWPPSDGPLVFSCP